MNQFNKKTIFLFSLLFFVAVNISAQQNHFIYLQTENKQPFYVKLDNKILSSSISGYLIIPKLQEGSYRLIIGFPKNEWPEQNVTCTINKKDVGYIIKNFGAKGWGLFNLQTMEVIMSATKAGENGTAAAEFKDDIFSTTLSDVVNDRSIAKKNEEKPVIKEEIKPAVNEDTVALVKDDAKPPVKEEISPVIETVKKEEPVKQPLSKVIKVVSSKNEEGIELMYVDITNGVSDTVSLFLPAEKKNETAVIVPEKKTEIAIVDSPKKEEPQKEDVLKAEIKKEEPSKEEVKKQELKKEETPTEEIKKVEAPKKESKKEAVKANDPKFIDIELPNPNIKKDTVLKDTIVPITPAENKAEVIQVPEKPKETNTKPLIGNSDCKNFASNDDYVKLRKKLIGESDEDAMVAIAKKAFKSKCFTTDQVKGLSILFLQDQGKYKFFDAAYPFVSDSYNFSALEKQLTDPYFVTRFKAMIHH